MGITTFAITLPHLDAALQFPLVGRAHRIHLTGGQGHPILGKVPTEMRVPRCTIALLRLALTAVASRCFIFTACHIPDLKTHITMGVSVAWCPHPCPPKLCLMRLLTPEQFTRTTSTCLLRHPPQASGSRFDQCSGMQLAMLDQQIHSRASHLLCPAHPDEMDTSSSTSVASKYWHL